MDALPRNLHPVHALLSTALDARGASPALPSPLSGADRWLLRAAFRRIAADPCEHRAHLAWLREEEEHRQQKDARYRLPLEPLAPPALKTILKKGAEAMADGEVLQLMVNPVALTQLHVAVDAQRPRAWEPPDDALEAAAALAATATPEHAIAAGLRVPRKATAEAEASTGPAEARGAEAGLPPARRRPGRKGSPRAVPAEQPHAASSLPAPIIFSFELRPEARALAKDATSRGLLLPRGAAAKTDAPSRGAALVLRAVEGGHEVKLEAPGARFEALFDDRDDLSLASLRLLDLKTRALIFESFIVVFRAASRAIGTYRIEDRRWRDEFPELEDAKLIRVEVIPLSRAEVREALALDPGGARGKLLRANAIKRSRDDDAGEAVRRLLERLPPAEKAP